MIFQSGVNSKKNEIVPSSQLQTITSQFCVVLPMCVHSSSTATCFHCCMRSLPFFSFAYQISPHKEFLYFRRPPPHVFTAVCVAFLFFSLHITIQRIWQSFEMYQISAQLDIRFLRCMRSVSFVLFSLPVTLVLSLSHVYTNHLSCAVLRVVHLWENHCVAECFEYCVHKIFVLCVYIWCGLQNSYHQK